MKESVEHIKTQGEGMLVISLDFELLWGVFDKVDYHKMQGYFYITRRLIPELLKLFSQYEVHVTWATVGMLFNDSWERWQDNIPQIIPDYKRRELSAYHYGHAISSPTTRDLCLAQDLVRAIADTPHQEVGTHTYSHYYCLEPGQTIEAFEQDLIKCVELAGEMGIQLKSLVFPRNQFNSSYLEVCHKLGIENVRSNPDVWYWNRPQRNAIQDKIFRTGDAYLGFNDKSYPITDLEWKVAQPLAQKASRLLRPHSGKALLDRMKINRIKSEMTTAARRQEIYHLWWHPHNFAHHPEQNLMELQEILSHFKKCQERYGFQSKNMAEVNSMVTV